MNKELQIGCHLWNAKISGKAGEKIAAAAADGSVHAKQLWCQPVKSIVKAAKLNGNRPESNPIHKRSVSYENICIQILWRKLKLRLKPWSYKKTRPSSGLCLQRQDPSMAHCTSTALCPHGWHGPEWPGDLCHSCKKTQTWGWIPDKKTRPGITHPFLVKEWNASFRSSNAPVLSHLLMISLGRKPEKFKWYFLISA